VSLADRYVVQPTIATWGYTQPVGGEPVPEGFHYRSDSNDQWLNVEKLRTMLAATDPAPSPVS